MSNSEIEPLRAGTSHRELESGRKETGTKLIQGLQYILSQNSSSLLQNFESERLQKPTGGSPDVVHLIKYALLVFG